MAGQLEVSVSLINQKLKFSGSAGSNPEITIDYIPPLGDGEGYTSLELLLISLASCSSSSIIALLRKMRKNVAGFNANAKGIRREVHPTAFEKIFLEFSLISEDAECSDIEKAIKLSEETFCPVWAMLKNNVEITYKYEVRTINDE